MILLQNEDWFLWWGYLKGKFHHYKMTIGFYHQVTWRGHSATTKWRLVFICVYHQVTWRENFNTTKWRLEMIGKYMCFTAGSACSHMLPSEGQLTLLQNEIGFLHVVFQWANSLATKWLPIFKGLSTTKTLKTHKMQFPSSVYKMPGPSPFFHLSLSLERHWNGAQGLPFCIWNSNGDHYIVLFKPYITNMLVRLYACAWHELKPPASSECAIQGIPVSPSRSSRKQLILAKRGHLDPPGQQTEVNNSWRVNKNPQNARAHWVIFHHLPHWSIYSKDS